MKTLVVDSKGELSVREVSKPSYSEYQCLVRMLSCGVCNGTDTKLIHRKFKNFNTYPAMLGHEGVGEVIEKGSKVTSFEIGDHVLLPFVEQELDGIYSGWGAYSEYAVVGDYKAAAACGKGSETADFNEGYLAQTIVPKSIDPVDASMIITFREVLSAIKRFGMQANETVVIFGAGPVGLCFTKFCSLLGLSKIIVIEKDPSKFDKALEMGAHNVFSSDEPELIKKLRGFEPDGFNYVVDAVGINSLINLAMQLVCYNGKICCYGISPELSMNLDWSLAPYNWTLHFVQWPSKREEGLANSTILNWIQTGVLNPGDFISDVIPFENILEAFKMVEERRAKSKIVIKY